MDYITLLDIQDEILACTDEDVAAGNEYIEHAAARVGVKPGQIELPVRFNVKRLGVCFACYNRCLLSVGTDPTAVFESGKYAESTDIYAQKLKFYKAELERLADTVLAADFTGEGGKAGAVISLGRG